MENVQFNEPEYGARVSAQKQASGLSRLVMKAGLAKDDAGAQRVLLIIAILAVVATAIILWTVMAPAAPPPETDLPL